MGEVFEAWDTLLNRRVALKTLSVPYPAAILRFMQEAQLQARVSHPNVCRIYDVDASGEVPVIAMQLVEGPNLHQAAPGLTVAELVEILAAVALAIHSAHRLNLIHRDLKPSNILLEPDDMGGWSTYVADFGLAKDLAGEALTEAHNVMGTPEYMPPELRSGAPGAVGPAADVFALGVTLQAVLELALGDGASGGAVAAARNPRSGRGVPRRLRIVIDRCLEERPQDRYHSAGELAEDLRRFLDGEPLLAERGQRRRQVLRFFRRRPTLTVALGLTLALGSGFLGWGRQRSARDQRQAALAQRFMLDARDLENRMRVERLVPAHDLRPALAELRRGLDRIRAEMAGMGPEAQGPGSLALGRGYCVLGDLEPALAVLNKAWKEGYRTPEAAYALSRVACEAYFLLVERAEMEDLELDLDNLRAVHGREARSYFDRSAGQTWEPTDLGEARILYLEGHYERAAAHARIAFRGNPWLYEAKIEEAYALTALGQARQARGDLDGALGFYREAHLAAELARSIGHSDDHSYLADMEWRLHWLQNPRLDPRERLALLDEAERLADQVGLLRPGSRRALYSKAYVLLCKARDLAGQGRDPEPELQRVERLIYPIGEEPGFERMAALKRRQVEQVRQGFRSRRPRAATVGG
jgi:serine/threonine-protein kinase